MNEQLNLFHNTTLEGRENVIEYSKKAENQNEKIYLFFKKYPENEMSASILEYNQVLTEGTPLTSYRRSLNFLMNKGLIVQVGFRKSNFDRKELTYKLLL